MKANSRIQKMSAFRLKSCSRSCLVVMLTFSALIVFGVLALNRYVFNDKATAIANFARSNADNFKSLDVAADTFTRDRPSGFHDKLNTSDKNDEFDGFATTTTAMRPSTSEEFAEGASRKLPAPKHRDLQLELLQRHRNKRYLVFPESSSFQLIFDLIIGIVDYSSFAILGITCAVAWELPSKPPSEVLEDLQLRLNDGTLGISRRNDSMQQAEYVATQPADELRWAHQQSNELDRFDKIPIWNQKDQSFRKYALNRAWDGEGQRMRHMLKEPPPHRVHSVFGKQRKPRQATSSDAFELKLQELNRREHLRTRQKLFGKIEKLFKARGHNGTECVLRALCETRRRSGEPRSFIAELLRAAFTLPTDLQPHELGSSGVATHYSDALQAPAADCALRYAFCPQSIWSDLPLGIHL